MDITLVSFHADFKGQGYYRRKAGRLAAFCEDHRIPTRIRERPSRREWLANTGQKPFFIREQMAVGDNVLWVDADARVGGNPLPMAAEALRPVDVAFAAFKGTDQGFTLASLSDNPMATPLRVMGVAHAWSQSEASLALLDRWCELCGGPLGHVHGDHRLMQYALDEFTVKDRIRFAYFPPEIGHGPLVSLGLANGIRGRAKSMRRSMAQKHRR
jgi:hypothetical protein